MNPGKVQSLGRFFCGRSMPQEEASESNNPSASSCDSVSPVSGWGVWGSTAFSGEGVDTDASSSSSPSFVTSSSAAVVRASSFLASLFFGGGFFVVDVLSRVQKLVHIIKHLGENATAVPPGPLRVAVLIDIFLDARRRLLDMLLCVPGLMQEHSPADQLPGGEILQLHNAGRDIDILSEDGIRARVGLVEDHISIGIGAP